MLSRLLFVTQIFLAKLKEQVPTNRQPKMNIVLFACFFMLAFVILLCSVVLGFAVYILREHRRFGHLPGPKRSNFWLGNAKDIAAFRKKGKTFYDYFLAQAIEHSNLFVVFVCHKAIVFVSEPSIIRELLLKHHLLLPKDPKVYRKLGFVCEQPIAGHGLVTNTDEASWKPRRRCLKHAFQHGNISTKFVKAFNDCAQMFLERLQDKADGQTKIFMLEEFTRVALLSSDQAICGEDSKLTSENFDEIFQAFEKCLEAVQANLTTVIPHSLTRFFTKKTSRQREFIAAAKTVRHFAREVIESRERKLAREMHDAPTDLLAYILDIAENQPNFTMEEKIDEVVTFFVAAHDTTAGCLAFTLFEILSNEKIYQRVLQEIDIVIGPKTFITDKDLNKLHFLHYCIKESLRLYPVVGGPDRILVKDLVVQGYYLPKGCSVFLEKYVAHRNPKYWNNPQTFDPYRFNKRQSKTITSGAYFPFSLGPRNCIGKVFAEVQIKLLLVRLFQTFHLELAPGQSERIKERLTLRPRDGVVCTVKRRQFPKAKLTRSMTCT